LQRLIQKHGELLSNFGFNFVNLRHYIEVLHKFLVFFAEFEWDKSAVSIHGAVPLAKLDSVQSQPLDAPDGLLLSKVGSCVVSFHFF